MDNSSPTNSYLLRCSELTRELPAASNGAAKDAAKQAESAPAPRRALVSHISFEVAAGEVLAVVGPSGSGKSTLLRLLNRLDEPTGGTVVLNFSKLLDSSGRGPVDYRSIPMRELRRRVGMVMQRAYLFPGTVAENVAFGPAQHGQTMAPAAIDDLLDRVGLRGYGGRSALTLSGGEAQRVAITRALANAPELLLLDEPTSALDEAARDGVETLLSSLICEQHLTCIWVTHDQAQAARLADTVLRLEAGLVFAYGPVDEVLGANGGRVPRVAQ